MNISIITHLQNIKIGSEDWYRIFYSVVPNASLFTIIPPPEGSSAATINFAHFTTPQFVMENNPPTAGTELVEKILRILLMMLYCY